ncbi:phage holin family protein [Clostridium cadaveris]|uniref:phage holin family protein n=1 Tax=Clostridium cadaveris TaxID=1529 RepID=UPI003993FF3B
MDFMKFIPEQLMFLVAGLFVLGMFLKWTPKVQDWLIPWLLIVVGICCSVGLSGGFTVTAVLQGIICVGAAVLTNQLFKQTAEGFNISKENKIVKEINPTNTTEFRE